MREFVKKSANVLVNMCLVVLVLAAVVLALARFAPERQLPVVGGLRVLVVDGGSMEPAIRVGSVIVVRRLDPERIQVGDVISFTTPTRRGSSGAPTIATHRVIHVTREKVYGDHGTVALRTKGDANEEPDIQAISGASVLGKLVLALPYLGYVVRFGQTPLGIAVLILVPALVLAAAWGSDLVARTKRRGDSAVV
ncbi:MAG: signal peptidase I [Coriobacteriales bacterium]|nr:signal peptidase I [Coriobacteriales bacterium]